MAQFGSRLRSLASTLRRLLTAENYNSSPPPTTATLQTKNSQLAPIVDYYGSTLVFALITFLFGVTVTGGRAILSLAAALILTAGFFSLRRAAAARRREADLSRRAAELCCRNIMAEVAQNGSFPFLRDLLSPLAYRDITYTERTESGLTLARATRNGARVFIAFYGPDSAPATVGRSLADSFAAAAVRERPDISLFLTTAPLSVAAAQAFASPQFPVPVTVYTRERLVALCRRTGHRVYPDAAGLAAGAAPSPRLELSLAQSVEADKKHIRSYFFTGSFLFFLSLLLGNAFGLRTVYLGFAAYNLLMVAVTYARLNRRRRLIENLLADEAGPPADRPADENK